MKLKKVVPMNYGLLQTTLAVLVVLILLVTACAPTSTPASTAEPTNPPAHTSTPTSPPAPTATATPVPPTATATPVPDPHPGWTSYTDANYVFDMAFDHDGNLWAVSAGGGVVRWDPADGTYTRYTVDDGLADNSVYSIAVAPDGALWFGTGKGVSRFDGETWTTHTASDGLAGNDVLSIGVAPDGALWFGTGKGVSRFDGETLRAEPQGEAWTTYTTDDGLGNDKVASIAVTSDGALWFGTYGGGVSRFDGETLRAEPQGEAWITYTTDDGLAGNDVTSIAVTPDGALWFGTWQGISRFDGEAWATYTIEGPTETEVESIAVAPDGALWFAWVRMGGVSRFDGETWTTYTTDDGLASDIVTSIVVAPDGALWFGTQGGVSRFDGETLRAEPQGEAWTTYATTDGPAANERRSHRRGPRRRAVVRH